MWVMTDDGGLGCCEGGSRGAEIRRGSFVLLPGGEQNVVNVKKRMGFISKGSVRLVYR